MLTIQRYELCFLYDMVMVVVDSNNLKHNGSLPTRTTSKKKSHFFSTPVHRKSHPFMPPLRNTTCQKNVRFCSVRGYENSFSNPTKYWRRQLFEKTKWPVMPSSSEKNPAFFDQRAPRSSDTHFPVSNFKNGAGIILYSKIIGRSNVRVGVWRSNRKLLLFLVWLWLARRAYHNHQRKTKLFLQSDLFPRTWPGEKTKFFYEDGAKNPNPPLGINLKMLVENLEYLMDVEFEVRKKASFFSSETFFLRAAFSNTPRVSLFYPYIRPVGYQRYAGVQKASLGLFLQPSYTQPFTRSALLRWGRMQKNKKKLPNLCTTFAGHPQNWLKISKISLHATSNKLLAQPDFFTAFNLAFCCFSMQTPHMINSRRSISTYKLLKGVFIGVKSHLRKATCVAFCYKWFYLAAGAYNNSSFQAQSSLLNTCLGINNVFVYPELDRLNYSLFEPIPGFDVAFFFASRDK